MDLETVKKRWTLAERDVAAEISAWDSVAAEYIRERKNSFEEDPFLRFVAKKVTLDRSLTVLDIGCGAGAYTVAMAERAGQVDGVDFSPEMLRLAREYAARNQIQNVRFLERNWHSCDGEEFNGKYDLVFAHTTPAVLDYNTFMKLYGASRRWCFLSKPCRRTDPVFDRIRELAGVERQTAEEPVLYMFDILWHLGACPEFDYAKTTWYAEHSLEEAERWYLGRLKSSNRLDRKTEDKIRDFLREIAENGIVKERIDTTLVSLFWSVET